MGQNESYPFSPNCFTNYKINRNHFDFQYVIGKGGFGQVWRVVFKKNLKLYALKEMAKVKVIDRKSEKSIQAERDFLTKLRHPFIVNMSLSFQDYDNLYLVLDYLSGGDLRYHITMNKTFTEEQTKFFIACVLLGLEFIHDNNIIHRDIKPENLVCDENGYVRITDFGIAKVCHEDNSNETSGTPGYMAPEVLCELNYTYAVDLFAIGVIGYECMKGERPYLGKTRKEIKQLVLRRQAMIYNEDIKNGWSIESADFINKLLKRKETQRLGYEGGVKELKQHEWFNGFDWEKLLNKTMISPFAPDPLINFDKRYCESQDVINAETLGRYQGYTQKNNFKSLFDNYTFVSELELSEYFSLKSFIHHTEIKQVTQQKGMKSLRSNSTIVSNPLLKQNTYKTANSLVHLNPVIQKDHANNQRSNFGSNKKTSNKVYIDIRKNSLSFLRKHKPINLGNSYNNNIVSNPREQKTKKKLSKEIGKEFSSNLIYLLPLKLPSLNIIPSLENRNKLISFNKKKSKLSIPISVPSNAYKSFSFQKSNSTKSICDSYLKYWPKCNSVKTTFINDNKVNSQIE